MGVSLSFMCDNGHPIDTINLHKILGISIETLWFPTTCDIGQMLCNVAQHPDGLKYLPKVVKLWRRYKRIWKTIWRQNEWHFRAFISCQMMSYLKF